MKIKNYLLQFISYNDILNIVGESVMKKKNKKDYSNKRFILVFIMMLCLIISMSTYWVYAYHHKYGKNYYEDKFISYNRVQRRNLMKIIKTVR